MEKIQQQDGHLTNGPAERPSVAESSVEKDAARYRWLRETTFWSTHNIICDDLYNGLENLNGADLDAAIDAAIDAARAQSQGTEEEK